jgi:hypothetical protein
MKGVATDYEELRQRQRKAMAEQMLLDEESLAKMEAQRAMDPAVSLPACLLRCVRSFPALLPITCTGCAGCTVNACGSSVSAGEAPAWSFSVGRH